MTEGWVEIPRSEALARIERVMTVDLTAFEVERVVDETPVGPVETFTWILIDDLGEQVVAFLCMRDPVLDEAPMRWFVNAELASKET